MQDRPKHSPSDEVPSSRRLKGENRGRGEAGAGIVPGGGGVLPVWRGQLRSSGDQKVRKPTCKCMYSCIYQRSMPRTELPRTSSARLYDMRLTRAVVQTCGQ